MCASTSSVAVATVRNADRIRIRRFVALCLGVEGVSYLAAGRARPLMRSRRLV